TGQYDSASAPVRAADLDGLPGNRVLARTQDLHDGFLRGEARREALGATRSGAYVQLVRGEHALQVAVAEPVDARRDVADGDDIAADTCRRDAGAAAIVHGSLLGMRCTR